MAISDQVSLGVERLLWEYAKLRPGERLVVVTALDGALIDQLESTALDRAISVERLAASSPFEMLTPKFENSDVVMYLETTSSTHRDSMLEYLRNCLSPRPRVYRVFDFSPELFRLALSTPQKLLDELNMSVIQTLRNAGRVTVTSPAGTDLEIELSDRFGWINSMGHFDSEHPGVLPPGEVATYSNRVNGTVWANGALNTNFGFPGDPRLNDCPVRLEIENSRVTHASCSSPLVNRVLQGMLATEHGDRVGEVGFGTNVGINEFVPFLSHINERFPCLHLGLGSNNQGELVTGWQTRFHLDIIIGWCDVLAESTQVLSNGRYFLNGLKDLAAAPTVQIGYADTI